MVSELPQSHRGAGQSMGRPPLHSVTWLLNLLLSQYLRKRGGKNIFKRGYWDKQPFKLLLRKGGLGMPIPPIFLQRTGEQRARGSVRV